MSDVVLSKLVDAAGAGLTNVQLAVVIEQLPVAAAIVEAPSGKTIVANTLNGEIFRQRGTQAREGLEEYKAFIGLRSDGTKLGARDWPLARSILSGEVVRGEEVEIVRGDGTHAFIRINSGPVRDVDGRIIAGVVIFDDITETKRANEIIRFLSEASHILASSLDYETTLKAVASIAVPKLADWCTIDILAGNVPEQVAVAHVDPSKVELAIELRRRYPPDMDAPVGLPRVLREGVPEIHRDIPDELIESLLKHDPERLRITRGLGLRSAITVPLLSSGKPIGALSLVSAESGRRFDDRDLHMAQEVAARASLAIENARLYREAQEAIRLRDDFLSVAAHELRTPLHALQLQASGMLLARKRRPDAPTPPEKLERLSAQLERMSTLVTSLLDVTRLVSGKLDLERREVDLGSVARDAIARAQDEPARGSGGSSIALDVVGDARGSWDLERVDQVVSNLVSNAIKYGGGKPIHVVVDGADPSFVTFSVQDQGLGISEHDQRRIFGRFERALSTRHFAGLGLGLWIVRQAVEAHGGAVSVSSQPGAGATFTVRLPRT